MRKFAGRSFTTTRTGALKSRDLTSRDLTTRHQIKQIATSWTSVGPRKNWTCWTISELNSVCYDSTAALVVACSFRVQSAILSALIRSPYSRGSTTEATATAARTKSRTSSRLCQQRQLQGRRNRQRQPRQQPQTTVSKCASWHHVLVSHRWCAGIEHVDSIQDDARMTKKTFIRIDLSIIHTIIHYFTVRPNVDQRVGQLSLPHVGIIKTERNRTTDIKPMSSSYNTRCIKHKLIVSNLIEHWNKSRDVHLAIWCRVVQSRDVRSCVFSRPLGHFPQTKKIKY